MSKDSRRNLGKILREQRHSADITLQKLSDASGVSPSHLGRIEKGERFPSADVLQRIAQPLGFSEEELFTLAGYLSSHLTAEMVKDPSAHNTSNLDPYVARIIGQEPVEVQRAVLGILTIIKNIAAGLPLSKDLQLGEVSKLN